MDLSQCSPAEVDFPATWPGATQPESFIKPRPEPPRAPRRGPAVALWAVPPLALPAGAGKLGGRRSADSSTNDGSSQETGGSDGDCAESDGEEDSEICVFSLGGAACENGDEEGPGHGPTGDFQLFDLDEDAWAPELVAHAEPLAKGVASKGEGGGAPAWALGASPVLLSAIERVAAAQGLGRQLSV